MQDAFPRLIFFDEGIFNSSSNGVESRYENFYILIFIAYEIFELLEVK